MSETMGPVQLLLVGFDPEAQLRGDPRRSSSACPSATSSASSTC